MDFRVLGPVEVVHGDEPISLGGPQRRAVLALLLTHVNEAVSADFLIEELWAGDAPQAARKTLQSHVANLRKAVNVGRERLRASSPGYVLEADTAEVDALRFEELVRSAQGRLSTDAAGARTMLLEALDLWRGAPYVDVADTPALLPETTRLQQLRLEAVEAQVEADLALGRHGEVVGELEALVREHPFRERMWGQLMLALYRSGRQADALRAFQRARRTLGEELGIEPSPHLQRLEQQILDQDTELSLPSAEPQHDGAPRSILGYELREKIGEGAFGVVYRAFQPSVGREVAIKVIRPELSGDPEFIQRFEAEAHLVARLEHPQIVPLYDYWRDGSGAYLVMRSYPLGSLADALEQGPFRPDGAVRIVSQVASALALAHDQGIVHRDVKPSNILLDAERNAFLSDFGIAQDLGSDSAITAGSLSNYAAPEQRAGHTAGLSTDVYSLGLVAFQLLTGESPFPSATGALPVTEAADPLPAVHDLVSSLPEAVTDAVRRATNPDPKARYPDAMALADALAAALGSPTEIATPSVVRNPYKGLRAFEEGDAGDFFGREGLIDALTEALERSRLVAVVGPSGSGKSSVVQAGLVPRLRRGKPGRATTPFVVEVAPGRHPWEELEAVLLRIAVNPPPSLLEQLQSDGGGLMRAVKRVLPEGDSELVLIVDQFEELFTLVDDRETTRSVLDGLSTAVTDPRSRLRVVLTLRADFYDRPLMFDTFGELMRANLVTVLPLGSEELEDVIVEPAHRVGARVEPALIGEIIADVRDAPGALPLMQYALTEAFDRRRDGVITLDAYHDIGGIHGALARRAEEIYTSLSREAQRTARQIFLRLVTLGEGADDTRRRVLRTELADLPATAAVIDEVLEAYGAARLLSFDRDPSSRAPTVEVAHEALLREWHRLRDWIEANRDDLKQRERLDRTAREWTAADRAPEFLLGGGRLAQAEAWAAETDLPLSPLEAEYLTTSLAERNALTRRRRRLRRAVVATLGAATILASTLALFAFDQRGEARRQADSAEQQSQIAAEQARLAFENEQLARIRELAAAAVNELDNDPQRSLLLALEAAEMSLDGSGELLREAEEALRRSILESRLELIITPGGETGSIASVAAVFDPTSRRLAVGSADGATRLFDPTSGDQLAVFEGHEDAVIDVKWMRSGTEFLTVSLDGTARLWDTDTGLTTQTFGPLSDAMLIGSISPDETRVATSSGDGTVRVWDVSSGSEIGRIVLGPGPLSPVGVAFDPVSGDRIAVAVEGPGEFGAGFKIFNAATAEEELAVVTPDGTCELRWSPDGSRIATASADTRGTVWDAVTGEEVAYFTGHHSFLCTVDFSPDGSLVVTGGDDGAARIWEAATGKPVLRLEGHEERIGFASFSPDGRRLATSSDDQTVRIWDVRPEGRREVLALPDGTVAFEVRYSPDGRRLLTASMSGVASVWDAADGRLIAELAGHESWVYTAAFSSDGSRIVTASRDSTARVWDAETGAELLRADLPFPGLAVASAPNGTTFAIGTFLTLHLWDSVTGEIRSADTWEPAWGVSFSPDGSQVVVGGTTDIIWFDVAAFDEVERVSFSDAFFEEVLSAVHSPDGTMLLTAHRDGLVRLWDASSRTEIRRFEGHTGLVWEAAFSPDASIIATASFDGTVRVWDSATTEEVLRLEDESALTSVAFSPDGRHLAISGDLGARIHTLDAAELLRIARSRLLRWWTAEECFQYLGGADCPDQHSG